jgi:hypothetical protein
MPARSAIGERGPLNSRPCQFSSFLLGQVQAGIGREVRRADQVAARIVGPAMDRADDVLRVAGPLQHDGLPVAADVGHLVVAVRLVRHQARMVVPLLGAVVMHFGNHQFVADVARSGIEDQLFLQFEELFIEIPLNRKLRHPGRQERTRADIRHDSQPPRGFTRKPETDGNDRQDRQTGGKTSRAIVANLTGGRTLGYFYAFPLPLVTASGQGFTHGHYLEYSSRHRFRKRDTSFV